jgi:ubiquinone/menaquinone biosynthesis C-methylase UbiE
MPSNLDRTVLLQRQYYTDTAAEYDTAHAGEGDDDPVNLRLLFGFLRMIEARTVLDIGAGTGRAIRHLMDNMPDVSVRGVEPVAARIDQAIQNKGIPRGTIIQGVGEALPFENASIDAVCAFGMLHHVNNPDAVVSEMLRVARKAVIIVDGNRFGLGSWPVRVLKLALYKAGVWKIVNYLKTGGKGYNLTEGDGLFYSYSVYDSFDRIAEWAGQLIVLPNEACKARSWLHPLLTSGGVFLCALKETV